MSSNRNIIIQVFKEYILIMDATTHKCHQIPSKFNITQKSGYTQLSFYLPTLVNLSKVKAMIMMAEINFTSPSDAYKFRLKLEEFCKKHGIFFYLSSSFYFLIYHAILKSKTLVKNGEKVLVLLPLSDTSPTGIILIREGDCYRIDDADFENASYSEKWKVQFLGDTKPAKVVILGFQSTFCDAIKCVGTLKNLFKEYQPFLAIEDKINATCTSAAVVAKILHLMGEKSSPYDIATMCKSNYSVSYGDKYLFPTSASAVLPMEKSFIVDVDPGKTVTFIDEGEKPPKVIQETKLTWFKSKKAKVILTLDLNAFYHFKVEAYDEEMEAKMSKLNVAEKSMDDGKEKWVKAELDKKSTVADKPSSPEKVRFIFDEQNFSVYAFGRGKECIVKDVDGLDKTPIYISFIEEKPVVGKVAMDVYAKKPKFVVFDLIELCSTSNADIVNPKWGFSLFMEDDTLLVSMQTLEDEKKATVAFLLALILKNGRDRIKKAYGKRMKEIEVGFNGFAPNETLKNNFIEAGNLLKISIVFV